MKSSKAVLVLSLLFGASSHAAAQESMAFTLEEAEPEVAPVKPAVVDPAEAIAHALGKLHWGMSKADLLKVLKAQIDAQFEQRIKVERDIMRQDALYQRAQELYRRLNDNYVEFDGTKTGWDVSPIAAEFSHRNGEAMLVVRNQDSRDLYFFMQGRLWKWYRELSADAPEAASADDGFSALTARFGRGERQKERVDASNVPYPGRVWSDTSTRVTAMRRDRDACLIFEDRRLVERLSAMRHNKQPKDEHAGTLTIDWALLPSPKPEAHARQ
jgi:hypothetical protein